MRDRPPLRMGGYRWLLQPPTQSAPRVLTPGTWQGRAVVVESDGQCAGHFLVHVCDDTDRPVLHLLCPRCGGTAEVPERDA